MVKIQPILCSSVASIYLIKTLAKLGVIIKIKEIRDQKTQKAHIIVLREDVVKEIQRMASKRRKRK